MLSNFKNIFKQSPSDRSSSNPSPMLHPSAPLDMLIHLFLSLEDFSENILEVMLFVMTDR